MNLLSCLLKISFLYNLSDFLTRTIAKKEKLECIAYFTEIMHTAPKINPHYFEKNLNVKLVKISKKFKHN